MNVLNEVLHWSADRPAWQRDALRRLAQTGELSEPDIAELVQLCKTPHGLADAGSAVAKAPLRALHDQVIAIVGTFGAYEKAPKKSTVSLRRKKQFALLGPATQTQLEVGLNHKDLPAHPRLTVMPAGGMCQYAVRLSKAEEIDADLRGWLRAAYDAAG